MESRNRAEIREAKRRIETLESRLNEAEGEIDELRIVNERLQVEVSKWREMGKWREVVALPPAG